jgi:hypothetical protein
MRSLLPAAAVAVLAAAAARWPHRSGEEDQ